MLHTDVTLLQLQSTRPHLFTMALHYGVTLHVCTHLYSNIRFHFEIGFNHQYKHFCRKQGNVFTLFTFVYLFFSMRCSMWNICGTAQTIRAAFPAMLNYLSVLIFPMQLFVFMSCCPSHTSFMIGLQPCRKKIYPIQQTWQLKFKIQKHEGTKKYLLDGSVLISKNCAANYNIFEVSPRNKFERLLVLHFHKKKNNKLIN